MNPIKYTDVVWGEGMRDNPTSLFEKSDVMQGRNKHSNFTLFTPVAGELIVTVPRGRVDWASLDRDVTVLARWPGEWSSDVFLFCIGDYLDWLAEKGK